LLLNRPLPGRNVLRALATVPFLVTPSVMALLWKNLFLSPSTGIIDWLLHLVGLPAVAWFSSLPLESVIFIVAWEWTPFVMLVILAGLQSIPDEVLEAAKVDGAAAWTTFWRIVIPLLRKPYEIALLFGTIFIFQTFGEIYLTTAGGPGLTTNTLPYYTYRTALNSFQIGLAATLGVIGVITNGVIAQFVAVPMASAYLLPDTISLREAALKEPVSCAVHGMHSLNPRSGDTFLIVGAGTMGLLLLQLALRGGASRVAMVDVNAQRLASAEELGATRTYKDIERALADESLGFNCVIDATGVPAVIENAFMAVKRGGKFMVFGVASNEARISLSPFRIYNDEITIVGSMAILFSFQAALDLISSGVINTEAMLTAALPLQDFPKALDMVRQG